MKVTGDDAPRLTSLHKNDPRLSTRAQNTGEKITVDRYIVELPFFFNSLLEKEKNEKK